MGSIKIGVLIPKSDMYPTLGMDLLNGLKLGFSSDESFQLTPNFVIENVGVAGDDQVLKSAEKLILQEDVDLTIAFCGILKLSELVNFQNRYKRPLIHLDIGGRIYREEHISPYVLHHTLSMWQSSYAAGKYAVQEFGKKVLVAASYYDGAYHMTEAFNRGIISEGGEITRFFISNANYKTETFDGLFQSIEEEEPDVVFCLFSYKEALQLMSAYAKSEYNGKIPLLAVPVMTDETIATEDLEIKQLQTVSSWSFDDPNPDMKKFISNYQEAYDDLPNIIGLMGYEVSQSIVASISSEGKLSGELSKAMEGKTLSSPRGPLRYNRFNESQVEEFKVRNFEFNEVQYHNNVIGTIDCSFTEELQQELKDLPAHGWQNPYLCT